MGYTKLCLLAGVLVGGAAALPPCGAAFADGFNINQSERHLAFAAHVLSNDEKDGLSFERDFYHFDPLDVEYSFLAEIDTARARATVAQRSTISTSLFEAHGMTDLAAESFREDASAEAYAETWYAIFFTLDKPMTFRLTGFLDAEEFADAELQLEDPNFELIFDYYTTDGERVELDETVKLNPGFYTFSVGTTANVYVKGLGQEQATHGEFMVRFRPIPAPGAIGLLGIAGVLNARIRPRTAR